jgi:hypothetical protein
MATYETTLSGRRGEVMGPGWGREEICLTAIVAMTTAMLDNTNDDVGLFYVPAGFVVTGAGLRGTDMDAATSELLRIDIGDADDEDRIFAAVDVSGLYSNAMAAAGFLYKYTAKTQIRAYVQAAAGTEVAGTLYVALKGFVDPDFSTTALVAST